MNIKYANRMDNMQASAIREILKLTERPEVISFAGGLPAPELFPVEEMKMVSQKVLNDMGQSALQYSPTEGYKPLREQIAKRMEKFKVTARPEDILIISGSQQGLDFTGKIFLDPGDVVLVESPSYLGAINAFKAYECKFLEVPTDEFGMKPDALEEMIKTTDRIKYIYAIPDFQNPTGHTWSIERRKALVDLANKYDLPVIEDSPYSELVFDGEMPPSIKSFDTEGRVVFLGTFSKVFAPGLRIGWVMASPELLSQYIKVKQGSDLQSSSISQRELSAFLDEYSLDQHIDKIIEVYRKRRNLMMDEMKKHFPPSVKYSLPKGGLFTWVTLPENLDAKEVLAKAIEKNVACVPGGPFFPNGGNTNTMRMNYSNMPEEKIVEGVKRLGQVLEEFVD